MWATLALATALTLAPQASSGDVKITNVRPTYGELGPTRPDTKYLLGYIVVISFDIENLDIRDDGKVLYSVGMEVLNSKGKAEFSRDPVERTTTNVLGGSRVPSNAKTVVGTDTAPGEYTLKVTVTDARTKKSDTLTQKFEVLPKAFGLVNFQLTYALQVPLPAPPLGVPGQTIVLNYAVSNFERDKTSDQPNIGIQLRVLDDKGNSTLPKAIVEELRDVPKNMPVVTISFPVELNRPGKFTVELEATDKISKKSAKLVVPLQVIEPQAAVLVPK